CTNKNGNPDSEDLDGDNVLDAQGPNEDLYRYVINLATDSAKYFVRTTRVFPDVLHADTAHSATWTIYRVPLRGSTGVNGVPVDTIGNPDIHLIKQMRMTFVAPAVTTGAEKVVFVAFARMRFTGAAWASRSDRPISSLSGSIASTHGTVQVGTISTQD